MTDSYSPKVGHKVRLYGHTGVVRKLIGETISEVRTDLKTDMGFSFNVIGGNNAITYIPRHLVDTEHKNYSPHHDDPWDNPDNPAYDRYWAEYQPKHRREPGND